MPCRGSFGHILTMQLEPPKKTGFNISGLCFVHKNEDLHIVLNMHGVQASLQFQSHFPLDKARQLNPKAVPFMVEGFHRLLIPLPREIILG